MKVNNQYESLRIHYVGENRQFPADSEMKVSSSPAEQIFILTKSMEPGWIYGYSVDWANGRRSFRNPSTDIGFFKTERDARLHCIGFFKVYREFFLPDTMANIMAAEKRIWQDGDRLFD